MMENEYLEHKVFSEIETYMSVYDSLSHTIMGFITSGVKSIINLDTYILTSIHGTLESISVVLKNGRINDAYSLLRKYYESVIINAWEISYLQREFNIDTFIVEKIEKWKNDPKSKLPGFLKMKQYLDASPGLKSINAIIFKDSLYQIIKNRCNNHMHYNFFHYMLINDNKLYNKNRIKYLDQFSEDVRNIFILHFAYMFTLNPHYMMASDYIDALDLGQQPQDDSQLWVAPFIQETFNSVIKNFRPDIAEIMKNESPMALE